MNAPARFSHPECCRVRLRMSLTTGLWRTYQVGTDARQELGRRGSQRETARQYAS